MKSNRKLFKFFIYWAIYLGLCFISGWFASGVVENYVSRQTSFSQNEEVAIKRPVITIEIKSENNSVQDPLFNDTFWIQYCPFYRAWGECSCYYLDIGESEFPIEKLNNTEKIFFDKNEFYDTYRIIPLTNLLEERASGDIIIQTIKELNIEVDIYVTSLENSLGYLLAKWNDGDYLGYRIETNSLREFKIKPEKYYFLPQTSKCHEESYYECIASNLDRLDFNQTSCTKKCIPMIFLENGP